MKNMCKTSIRRAIGGFLLCVIAVVCVCTQRNLLQGFDLQEIDTQKYPIEAFGDYLEYRTKANQVVIKGNGFVNYRDMKIRADTIQANTNSEDLFAQGNVDFWKEYDQTRGDFLAYNMKTGKGWMRDASIIRNRNFFRAREVYVSPAYSLAKDVMQTTCEHYEHPHYRIQSEKIEIVPGHQMALEDLRLKWRGRTVYRKAMDRSQLLKKETFFHTRQGMSQIDGFYFKFDTDLEVTPDLHGRFSMDYFDKRGTGYGFTGNWSGADSSSGNFSIYHLDETLRNHSNTQINLSHNYRFRAGHSLSSSIAYTGDKVIGQAENQDLNIQFSLTPVLSFMTMNITGSKFFDLDGNRYTLDDGYQVLNRLPEINFSFPAFRMSAVPISMNLSGMYGAYEEGTLKDKKNTEKKDFRSNFTVPTVKVNSRFEFTPSFDFQKSFYTGGTERENTTTMIRANQRFSKITNLEFNYNRSVQRGKSPFRFDMFTATDIISTRMRIAENTWTLNPINFNYNRTGQRLEQVYWDYSRRSRSESYRNWEFFMRRDYVPDTAPLSKMSFTRLVPGNFNARYRLSTALWSFDTSITYPHTYRRITNTSMNYRAVIRPLWQVNMSGHYAHLNKKFSPLTIGLVRDLHCWEARAQYNHELKEVWVEFYLKAYPDDTGRFRYGADTNRLEAKLAAYDQMTQRYEGLRR